MPEKQRETSSRGAKEPETVRRRTAAGRPEDDPIASGLATAVAVGVGVALLEAELIPGMLIGVGAMLVPKLLPGLKDVLRPLAKTAVRAGYTTAIKAREMAAEATEQFQDLVAETKDEIEAAASATAGEHTRRPRKTAA